MNSGFRGSQDSSQASRIARSAFAMTMLIVVTLGTILLALTLSEIPANYRRANASAANIMGEIVSSDLGSQLRELNQLSHSSLVWTALSDSNGRDAYLKPFLDARRKELGGDEILLLDYRGRPVLGGLPRDIDPKEVSRLTARVLAEQKPKIVVLHEGQGPEFLVALPVLFPYAQEPIGVLVGTIHLSDIFHQRASGFGAETGVALIHQETLLEQHPGPVTERYFPEQFTLNVGSEIEGGAPRLQVYSISNPWVQPVLKRILIAVLLAVFLGVVIWRIAMVVAQRITQRLHSLAEACTAISSGQARTIPEDPAQDEIGVLSRTLSQAFSAYEHINTHLETMVAEKTRALLENEAKLKGSEERLRTIFEFLPVGICVANWQGHLVDCNSMAETLLGIDREEILTRGQDGDAWQVRRPDGSPMPPEEWPNVRALAENTAILNVEMEVLTPQGSTWLVASAIPIDHQDSRLVTVFSDISARKEAEAKLRQAASVFTSSQEGIIIADADKQIIDVNPAFTRITGYGREEVLATDPRFLDAGTQAPEFYAAMAEELERSGSWLGEVWAQRKSKEVFPVRLSIDTVRGADDRVAQYVAVFSDISRAKEYEEELNRIAHYDPLTGAPNRRLLGDRLNQFIARAKRSGKMLAVCYLDLDGFKPINDQYGHDAGDKLLVEITARLRKTLRSDDTLARLGGDEFVLLFSELARSQEIDKVLERVLAEVREPIWIDSVPVQVSASIGVSLYPSDGQDADILLRQADQAMYRAKELGKNSYHLFDPGHG